MHNARAPAPRPNPLRFAARLARPSVPDSRNGRVCVRALASRRRKAANKCTGVNHADGVESRVSRIPLRCATLKSRMTHISGFERSQLLLLPEAGDDYFGPDNPVRFIDAFVDELDLAGAGFRRVEPKATGRPGYAPGDLLKLYIYGYLNRERKEQDDRRPGSDHSGRRHGSVDANRRTGPRHP